MAVCAAGNGLGIPEFGLDDGAEATANQAQQAFVGHFVTDTDTQAAQDALAGKNNVGDCLSFRASSSGRPGIVIGDNVFF